MNTPVIRTSVVAAIALALLSENAVAETLLTVDLSTILRPATRVASGSLYGVTEAVPADVEALIAPLRPKMFTNPAANVQQPVGDAIDVAERLAPTGATVTVRLVDWFPGWPYNFTNMDDWFDKIAETVGRKQQAGLTNIYAYEIWNEPDLTYQAGNPLPFNEFWRQTFEELRVQDPGEKITGPSLTHYNEGWLRDFLSFCNQNDCLPDIVGWHELAGANLTANIQAYRELEVELGIGPLPISINEYSGNDRIEVEGQPGISAPLIAKFERLGVDTACISFWDVPNPGRLGSLLASNTAPNAGWWFYKWYGDMTGVMVATTPPSPNVVTALDGFANLDTANGFASVAFGGVNDGTIRVVVNGLAASGIFGTTAHAIVEHTPWVNRSTPVNSTNTLDDQQLPIANDQLEFVISNASDVDGYRIYLMGEPVAETTSGSGGSTGTTGTASSVGGSSSTAGSSTGDAAAVSSVGGASAVSGTGGSATTGGVTATSSSTNGTISVGSTTVGGVTATGSSTSGTISVGSTTVGGVTATGSSTNGPTSIGGTTASGATTGLAGTASTGMPTGAAGPTNDASGCSCRVPVRPTRSAWLAVIGLGLAALVARRRRRSTERTLE